MDIIRGVFYVAIAIWFTYLMGFSFMDVVYFCVSGYVPAYLTLKWFLKRIEKGTWTVRDRAIALVVSVLSWGIILSIACLLAWSLFLKRQVARIKNFFIIHDPEAPAKW